MEPMRPSLTESRVLSVLAAMVLVAAVIGLISWLVMPPDWTGHPQHKTEGKMDAIQSGEMAGYWFTMIAVPWWSLLAIVVGFALAYGFFWNLPLWPEKAILAPATGFLVVHFFDALLDYGGELATGGTDFMSATLMYGILFVMILVGVAAHHVGIYDSSNVAEEVGIW